MEIGFYRMNTWHNYFRSTALLIALLGLFACSDDDNDASTPMDGNENQSEIVFSDFSLHHNSTQSVEISFITSAPSTCEILYGLSDDDLSQLASDPAMMPGDLSTEHNVPLEGLTPNTLYYYQARATDEVGATYFSQLRTFTTEQETEESATQSNVALLSMGTTVVDVSSNFGGAENDESWGANQAIDGSFSSEWSSDGDGDAAYLTLDLGQQRLITGFGIRSRKMMDGSAIITSVQLIFEESTTLGPYAMPDPQELYLFDFDEPIAAQLVRVEILSSSGGNTGLKEIQLFAAIEE